MKYSDPRFAFALNYIHMQETGAQVLLFWISLIFHLACLFVCLNICSPVQVNLIVQLFSQ